MSTNLGGIAFIVVVLYVPAFTAGATIPRIAFLSIILPAFLIFNRVRIPVPVLASMGVLFGYLWWAPNAYDALDAYWLLLLWATAFCIGREANDLKEVFAGAALGMWVNSAFVVAEHFGYVWFPHVTDYAGIFGNKNFAIEGAAIIAAGCVGYRIWWVLPGLLPTLLAGQRAPLLALGVAAALALWQRSRFLAFMALNFAFLAAAFVWSRYDWITGSLEERVGLYRDVVANLTWWGHGFASTSSQFSSMQVHTDALKIRFDTLHSEPLQLVFELGIVGVLFMAVVLWRFIRVRPNAVWYALAVALVEATVSFTFHMAVPGFLTALCTGYVFGPRVALRRGIFAGDVDVLLGRTTTVDRVVHGSEPNFPAQSDHTFIYSLRARSAAGPDGLGDNSTRADGSLEGRSVHAGPALPLGADILETREQTRV